MDELCAKTASVDAIVSIESEELYFVQKSDISEQICCRNSSRVNVRASACCWTRWQPSARTEPAGAGMLGLAKT